LSDCAPCCIAAALGCGLNENVTTFTTTIPLGYHAGTS
jgi:hypothetical protein